MIKYILYKEGMIIYTFISPAQILIGDDIEFKLEDIAKTYTVKSRLVQVTLQGTEVILNCK